ncbi:hypothetical protein DPMN_029012 [Dreissena polymorpha]|uniref:Uncharacterized protein n=1 Tax=Dreissena polymorpha TaxID=45954 RepID=A0A9D4RF31_DREPO|nr:hypothetical protein DPMN_029012 [Dreissena polymorpha]
MATTVSRSLPDGIGQGHRPMPDQLATAILSLSGDYAGHFMTGSSPVRHRGPVIGPTHRSTVNRDRSGHRSDPLETGPGTGQQRLVRSPIQNTGPVTGHTHRSMETGPVSDHSGHRSELPVTGHRSYVTDDRSPVNTTGHRSTDRSPDTG